MIGWLVLIAILIAVVWTARLVGDLGDRSQLRQAEVDLYRIHRTMQARELKREIRRDAQVMRNELRRELREIDDETP